MENVKISVALAFAQLIESIFKVRIAFAKGWFLFEKGLRLEDTKFVYVFIEAKIRQKTHSIFQICRNCDQKNMKIGKVSIFLPNLPISGFQK